MGVGAVPCLQPRRLLHCLQLGRVPLHSRPKAPGRPQKRDYSVILILYTFLVLYVLKFYFTL